MKRVFFYLINALLVTASTFAADTIVFKNGDTLTGKILTQDEKTISFSSASVGTISLHTSDIAEIRAEEPQTVTVKAPAAAAEAPGTKESDAALLLEQMANAAPQNTGEEAAPPPSDTAPAAAAKGAAAEQPPTVEPAKEVDRWSGQAGFALAMRENTDSNQNGVYRKEEFSTYRVYGNVNWKGDRNSLRWNWTYRYSEDETRTRDDFLNITQRYNRNFRGSYYTEAKTVYQQDYNRNIDNEFLQTAEIGKKWFQTSKFKFSTSVGCGYHKYRRSTTSETTDVSEPKFIFDESLEWKLVNTLTLFQKYTHLGSLEQYHFVFSSGLENKLIMDLFLRMEYRMDRDTDTSYDGKGYYDKALLASLLYKF